MKRIFTLIAVALSMAFTASAQSDLQVLSSLKTVDTIRYKTDGSYGRIVAYAFINHGPAALINTDSLYWKNPVLGTIRFSLPSGLPSGDTVYYVDTFAVTAPPATNPYTWCDSVWAKHTNGTIITDPVISNNKACKSVRFILVTTTGVATVAGQLNELVVYPNPADDKINFSFVSANNEVANATLRDIFGKTVMQKDLGKGTSGKLTNSLDVSSVQAGIYFLELSQGSTKSVSRIVVQ